jgi:autotransporter-associated beta strand protein
MAYPSLQSAGRRTALPAAAAAFGVLFIASSSAHAAPPGSGWDLVFADEFEGTSLDTLKWNYNYSWGRTHNHQAYMRENQVQVGDGVLNLQAIAQRDPSAPSYVDTGDFGRQYLNYTSGAVNTSGKFNFTGGYVEARMRMQDTAGTWPAFWMLKSGWPPEIDVMEFPRGSGNAANQFWANYHYTNDAGAHASYGWHDTRADLTTGFHTFGFAWSPTAMTFYFDGAATHTITDANAIADASGMYMILNHAIGGWAGTPAADSAFPINFQTDWVRVWQQRPTGSSTTSTWNISGNGSWDSGGAWTGLVPKYGSQQARFGRVGAAATAAVTWDNSRTVGSLVFEGGADGTTAYTIGDANAGLQLANGASADALIQALPSSQADQTVAARLELYNNTTINNQMADGHAVVLNGVITGTGNLTIDGPGVVQFSNNNTYTGNTFIDNGAAGPAIARVTRSRAFGTGVVTIGQNGNATTARIEITDNRELPNAITLCGRNNASAAIENLAGTNVLSGTITAQTGGSFYILQSDAGLLRLTANGTGTTTAGVSLRSAASGVRTFTLQGAGDGNVGGRVENGAATVGLIKAGAGTWSLDADNTYTGPTAVNAGRLLVNGNHAGGGAYTVATGATLGGAGTIDPSGANAVTVAGRLAPGNDTIGALTIGSAASPNDLALAGGTLHVEVAPADLVGTKYARQADQLVVTGRADLGAAADGTRLEVSLLDGFVPAAGSTFRLLEATSLAGQFRHVLGASLGPGADVHHARWAAAAYDATGVTLVVGERQLGDANLDGYVNFDDLLALAKGYNAIPANADSWLSGDFTGDRITNFDDLLILAKNYNAVPGAAPAATGVPAFDGDLRAAFTAAVPEPTSPAAIATLAGACFARRGRRRRTWT